MAGKYNQGPIGVSGDPVEFNDGTLVRGLSARPGSHVGSGTRRSTDEEAWSLSQLALKLNKLRNSTDGRELQIVAVYLFGRHCFSLGVIAGIGLDLISTVVELFKMMWMFVLADLHDLAAGEMTWRKYTSPKTLFAEAAARIFEEELREAAAERDLLLNELSEAFKNPKETFENVSNDIVQAYTNDWQEFQRNMTSLTLEGQFKAGKIFGGLLVDIIGLFTGVAGLGKTSAKLASKLPALAARAKKIGRIRKGTADVGGRSGGAGALGEGGTGKRPSELKTTKRNVKSNEVKKSQEEGGDVGEKSSPNQVYDTKPSKVKAKGSGHAKERHGPNRANKYEDRSHFDSDADIDRVISESDGYPSKTAERGGNKVTVFESSVEGTSVSPDTKIGTKTKTMTVVTRPDGTVITAHPGVPYNWGDQGAYR